MHTITVSPKFQIVIPQKIRESMNIKAGQKIQMIEYLDRIEILPLKNISDLKGFLKGKISEFQREEEDRI